MNYSNQTYETITFKKKYPSVYGVPVIDRFETSIFKFQYYTYCLSCDFCNDICCSNGVDIDIDNVNRIMTYAEQIEDYIKIPKTEWFLESYNNDHEFPGGKCTRTKVKDGSCVFMNKTGHYCNIHKFCMLNNINFHILKPIVSSLFPMTFDEGLLHPSNEVLDNSLLCLHKGPTLYQGIRDELIYYFGIEMANELDLFEKGTMSGHPLH